MKRLNSDKIYKYVPKQVEKENEPNTISLPVTNFKHPKHEIDYKRKRQKGRSIYHKNHPYNSDNFQKNRQNNQIYTRCSRCSKAISDQLSSFFNEEKNEHLCFDCALIEAKNLLSPDPKNRVLYLGAGTFGEIKEIKSEKKFMIIKRIKFSKPKYEKFSMNYLPFDQY